MVQGDEKHMAKEGYPGDVRQGQMEELGFEPVIQISLNRAVTQQKQHCRKPGMGHLHWRGERLEAKSPVGKLPKQGRQEKRVCTRVAA